MTVSLTLHLQRLGVVLAVCRLGPTQAVQPWMQHGAIWSITRTPDELSVVCAIEHVPEGVAHQGPFATFMVEGPLEFSLTGVLAHVSAPLADAAIPIFVLSTYDTDYVLVPRTHAAAAAQSWTGAGIIVSDGTAS